MTTPTILLASKIKVQPTEFFTVTRRILKTVAIFQLKVRAHSPPPPPQKKYLFNVCSSFVRFYKKLLNNEII